MDGYGNLTQVSEPRPGGGTYTASYTYDVLNHLTNVSMPRDGVTQTRTFVYDSTTQRLSTATNPENGTLSYTYNTNGTLLRKTDAKGQKAEYTYDDNQRVTEIKRFFANGTEDVCEYVKLSYDTNPYDGTFSQNTQGRVAAEQWGDVSCAGGKYHHFYSYTAAGRVTKKKLRVWRNVQQDQWTWVARSADLDDTATYDNEGRMATRGTADTYHYDTLGRPDKLTRLVNGIGVDVVRDALYGPAGELTQLRVVNGYLEGPLTYWTESRTYNARLQLATQTIAGVMNMEYHYSATQNNGRITSSKDWITGEEVTYAYDELQRLISAQTTGPEWGQSYGYDGFGNMTSQTVIRGTAPSLSINVNGANNRISSGGYSYDDNGNLTAAPGTTMSYDVENRVTVTAGEQYSYAPDNRRVSKKLASGAEEIYFYGITGQKKSASTLTIDTPGQRIYLTTLHTYDYFASKLVRVDNDAIASDRLGSVRAKGSLQMSYFPYGQERTTTANGQEKFGTYSRDAGGLDYANQRYYASGSGRFMTADPSKGVGLADPGSWNKYAYVGGDPANFADPSGLNRLMCDVYTDFGCAGPGRNGTPGVGWVINGLYGPEGWTIGGVGFLPGTPAGPGDPIGGGGGGGSSISGEEVAGKPLGFNGASTDLAKPDCYKMFGFASAADAQKSFSSINFQNKSMGNLEIQNEPDGTKTLSPTTPPAATGAIGGNTITLNGDVNWVNLSNVTAQNITTNQTEQLDFLAVWNNALKTNMTTSQLTALVLLHEFSHTRGAPQESDPVAFNNPIVEKCIK